MRISHPCAAQVDDDESERHEALGACCVAYGEATAEDVEVGQAWSLMEALYFSHHRGRSGAKRSDAAAPAPPRFLREPESETRLALKKVFRDDAVNDWLAARAAEAMARSREAASRADDDDDATALWKDVDALGSKRGFHCSQLESVS